MKNNTATAKMIETVCQREKQEKIASDVLTKQTLARLNVQAERLPQKSQQLLKQISDLTRGPLDLIAISLSQSRTISKNLEEDYELLKLKQKNEAIDVQIARNQKMIESLKRDLAESKKFLMSRTPNPDNVHDHIRQMRQKVASYEESCEKAKSKFKKLSAAEELYPKSLEVLINQLAALKSEEVDLKERADDVIFARKMKDRLSVFRR